MGIVASHGFFFFSLSSWVGLGLKRKGERRSDANGKCFGLLREWGGGSWRQKDPSSSESVMCCPPRPHAHALMTLRSLPFTRPFDFGLDPQCAEIVLAPGGKVPQSVSGQGSFSRAALTNRILVAHPRKPGLLALGFAAGHLLRVLGDRSRRSVLGGGHLASALRTPYRSWVSG